MTGVAPSFVRVGSSRLYALGSSADAGLDGFWAGYLTSPQASFGPSATLTEVWQDAGGSYVFLARTPADLAAFATQLIEVLAGLGPAGLLRALWIADPTIASGNWQLTALGARATGSGDAIAWTVARPATFVVGEYAVELPRGGALTQADPNALGWGIAVAGLTFAGPTTSCAADPATSWLPLAGPDVGGWRAQLSLPPDPDRDGLAALRVQIRYAAPHGDGQPGDPVDVLEAAVVAQGTAALPLHLRFDWLHPLLPARTRLGFFADDGSGPAIAPLAATLRTSRGYRTTLAPRTAAAPLWPAGLVLCTTPSTVADPPETASTTYHLAPDGAFDLAVVTPPDPGQDDRHRLMLGLSGQEYAALTAGAGAVALFRAGLPAFAPGAAPDAPPSPPTTASPLTAAATTAHVAILPPAPGPGLAYYAQPRQAPLYAAGGGLGSGVLGYLELVAARLPAWSNDPAVVPAVVPAAPLAGVAPSGGPLARRIEQAALAPARRQTIGLAPDGLGAAADSGTLAVTPQGLLVEAGTDEIERIVVAALPETEQDQLDLTAVGPHLRGALQSNELFFAVGDPGVYLDDSSVRYRLDATGLLVAAARGVPPTVISALRPIVLPGGVPRVFADEQEFDAAVGTVAGAQLPLLRELAGFLRAVLDEWTFQLSPRNWRTGGPDPTVMLFKFCHRSLVALAEDGAAWGWRAAAGGAQQVLRKTIARTRARFDDPTISRDDPYVAFYRDVLADPAWNGVLFLNAPVAIDALPPELQFLAAGIEPSHFYAHHLGFSATPVEAGASGIEIHRTAAFGLIDYQDPADLILDPKSPNPDFGFKTLSLTARFANAALTGFDARVELMVNRLLAAPLTKLDPTHGNNILLTGTSQRQGGTLAYAFALEGEHRYSADRTVIDSIVVDTVQAMTTAGVRGTGEVRATFALGGFLRFVDHPSFDGFGYGPAAVVPDPELDGRLRFDGLNVGMRFPLGAPGRITFGVALDGLRLDSARSAARRRSLIQNFPVALDALVGSTSLPPQDTGFTSIAVPLDQTPLEPPWYGLRYTLDLGTLGALAGATGLSLTMLVAWGAGAEEGARPAYVGLQLPGGMQWSLQSVMKLGFRSFQFETDPQPDGGLAYLLRLRRFALSILSISLPPGNLDLTLFGDPDHPDRRTVGWYAAYDGEPDGPARLAERS